MFQVYKDGSPYGDKFKEWSEAAEFAVESFIARHVQLGSHIKTIKFYSDVDAEIQECVD